MVKFHHPEMADLAKQLEFAPAKVRLEQINRAERLICLIEPSRSYPYEFVCYRITGYLPKTSTIKEVIKGDLLAEDLRLFISKLSGQIAEPIVNLKEKIYTIEQLAAELSVTTKTINRWRKKGLVAKKFVFEAGQKKLGITQSALDKKNATVQKAYRG